MRRREGKKLRQFLVAEVRDQLVGFFAERGFSVVPLPDDENTSDLKAAFPLGRLVRPRDGGLDLVEFQFDKRGEPKFVVNFGVVPENGVTLPWGDHLDQDSADASALPDAYRLYSSSVRKRWFGPSLLSGSGEAAAERIVRFAAPLMSEVVGWFEARTVGRHMVECGTREG